MRLVPARPFAGGRGLGVGETRVGLRPAIEEVPEAHCSTDSEVMQDRKALLDALGFPTCRFQEQLQGRLSELLALWNIVYRAK